jgi:hypothetical protein
VVQSDEQRTHPEGGKECRFAVDPTAQYRPQDYRDHDIETSIVGEQPPRPEPDQQNGEEKHDGAATRHVPKIQFGGAQIQSKQSLDMVFNSRRHAPIDSCVLQRSQSVAQLNCSFPGGNTPG